MTLVQWVSNKPWIVSYHPKTGQAYIPDSSFNDWDLFHLDDYFVTGVVAGTVWLMRKPGTIEGKDEFNPDFHTTRCTSEQCDCG